MRTYSGSFWLVKALQAVLFSLVKLPLLLCTLKAQAQEPQTQSSERLKESDHEWYLGAAMGYGQRSNPLVQSSSMDLYVILDIAWYGKRWFFDNGDVGFSLVDRDNFSVNWVSRLNSERLFFQKTNTRIVTVGGLPSAPQSGVPGPKGQDGTDGTNGAVGDQGNAGDQGDDGEFGVDVTPKLPPDESPDTDKAFKIPSRQFAIESGIEWMMDTDWGYWQASAFGDVSRTHEGYELSATYGKRFHFGRWIYDTSVGAAWKSARLNNYYYGVLQEESTSAVSAYDAGSGLNTYGRLLIRYPLSRQWQVAFLADVEYLNKAVTNSPLVEEKTVNSTYLGVKYVF